MYRILHELALSVGAKISFGKTVASVFVDDDEVPTVVLEDGTELKSDIIIGADGTKSLVREAVTQRADNGVDSGHSFYTLVHLIPSWHLDELLLQLHLFLNYPLISSSVLALILNTGNGKLTNILPVGSLFR